MEVKMLWICVLYHSGTETQRKTEQRHSELPQMDTDEGMSHRKDTDISV